MRSWLIALPLSLAAHAQTLKFEVASIKVNDLRPMQMDGSKMGLHLDGARVSLGAMSLTNLIVQAYQIEGFQLSGPDFLPVQRFDIQAKMPDGATQTQVPQMLQALLAERFRLKVRRETREQQVYALIASKDGSKLKETPADYVVPDTPFGGNRGNRLVISVFRPTPPAGWATISGVNGRNVYECNKIDMAEFARFLRSHTDEPVIDMTGLKGYYEVTLDVPQRSRAFAARRGAMERPADAPAPEASDPSGVNVFASIQKLGLKLEKRKAPIEHLVVEHVEKLPTEN